MHSNRGTRPAQAVVRSPAVAAATRAEDAWMEDDAARTSTVDDDAISVAVGVPLFIERPSPVLLPWAVRDAPGGRQEPVRYDRYYPTVRLLVDLLPSPQSVDPAEWARLQADVEAKNTLAAAHGYAYVPVVQGTPIDRGVFLAALTSVQGAPEPPRQDDRGATDAAAPGGSDDPISQALGVRGYMADAGPDVLPWAYRVLADDQPWAREPLTFTRYYWQIGVLVDVWPDRKTLTREQRAALAQEARYKATLTAAHGLRYATVWGDDLSGLEACRDPVDAVPER